MVNLQNAFRHLEGYKSHVLESTFFWIHITKLENVELMGRCFKVHNLVVIQLNITKLGQMTNLKMVFFVMVSIY